MEGKGLLSSRLTRLGPRERWKNGIPLIPSSFCCPSPAHLASEEEPFSPSSIRSRLSGQVRREFKVENFVTINRKPPCPFHYFYLRVESFFYTTGLKIKYSIFNFHVSNSILKFSFQKKQVHERNIFNYIGCGIYAWFFYLVCITWDGDSLSVPFFPWESSTVTVGPPCLWIRPCGPQRL